MSTQPLVSVLIPCHNAERWIGGCLESVLAQTWPSIEVVVVDDGSTDGSAGIVGRFSARGVRLLRTENRGAAAARNRAFAESRGAFIQYLDADDLLTPVKIALQAERLRAAEDCVAFGEWARFYDEPGVAAFDPQPTWKDQDPVTLLRALYGGNHMVHPAAWLVPRGIVEAAGPWNVGLSLDDDGEFFARVVLAARRVLFVPGARSLYRSGLRGSLSHRTSAAAWRSQFLSIDLSSGALLARDGSEETRRACADRWQRFIHSAYPEAPAERAEAEARLAALGGSTVRPDGGPLLRPVERLLGWKAARRLRRLVHAAGYQRLGYLRRARAQRKGRSS